MKGTIRDEMFHDAKGPFGGMGQNNFHNQTFDNIYFLKKVCYGNKLVFQNKFEVEFVNKFLYFENNISYKNKKIK